MLAESAWTSASTDGSQWFSRKMCGVLPTRAWCRSCIAATRVRSAGWRQYARSIWSNPRPRGSCGLAESALCQPAQPNARRTSVPAVFGQCTNTTNRAVVSPSTLSVGTVLQLWRCTRSSGDSGLPLCLPRPRPRLARRSNRPAPRQHPQAPKDRRRRAARSGSSARCAASRSAPSSS